MKVYTIKPLEWREWNTGDDKEPHYFAYAITGKRYFVSKSKRGWFRAYSDGNMEVAGRRSLEEAKKACFDHYVSALEEGLVGMYVAEHHIHN